MPIRKEPSRTFTKGGGDTLSSDTAWDHPAFFQEFRFRDMIQKLISGIKFVHNWAPSILEDCLGMDIIPIEVDRKFSEVTINRVFKFYLQFDLSYKLKKYVQLLGRRSNNGKPLTPEVRLNERKTLQVLLLMTQLENWHSIMSTKLNANLWQWLKY